VYEEVHLGIVIVM